MNGNGERRTSERRKTQGKATKVSTPEEERELAGVKRGQAWVSPRGGRALRAAARQ